MAAIVGFVLKHSKSLKKTATSQFLLINSNFFFVDLKILGGIILQVTSLQGGMLVKKGQANERPKKEKKKEKIGLDIRHADKHCDY